MQNLNFEISSIDLQINIKVKRLKIEIKSNENLDGLISKDFIAYIKDFISNTILPFSKQEKRNKIAPNLTQLLSNENINLSIDLNNVIIEIGKHNKKAIYHLDKANEIIEFLK